MKTKTIIFALVIAAAAARAQNATWLPSNTTGAMSLDYKALRANPLIGKHLENFTPGANYFSGTSAELAKQLTKSIDKMLVAIIPGANPADSHGVAFVSGAFDTTLIAAALKADSSCKVSVKDGVTVFAVPSVGPNGQSSVSYSAFPAKGLIVGSDNLDTLMNGLATMSKKSPALPSDSMVSRAVVNAAAKKYPLLLVGDTSSMIKGDQANSLFGTSLPSLVTFALKEKDAAHVLASLMGSFASEAEATQAVSTLNAMKLAYAMQMAAKPETASLAKLLSAVSLASNGKNATASAALDDALLNSLTSILSALMPAVPAK